MISGHFKDRRQENRDLYLIHKISVYGFMFGSLDPKPHTLNTLYPKPTGKVGAV